MQLDPIAVLADVQIRPVQLLDGLQRILGRGEADEAISARALGIVLGLGALGPLVVVIVVVLLIANDRALFDGTVFRKRFGQQGVRDGRVGRAVAHKNGLGEVGLGTGHDSISPVACSRGWN